MLLDLRPYRRDAALLAAVLAVVGGVYFGALNGGFHFDDVHSLVENPHVRSLANAPHFFRDPQMFSRNEGSEMYRPLVLLSYAINYRLGAYNATGYLLFNGLLHMAVVGLAFVCHRQLGLGAATAALATLLFGIHPLTAETVNYISARSESLAALFYIAALIFYVRSSRLSAFLSLVAFVLALLCKATAVTLPLVLLLADLCLRGGGPSVRWRRMAGHWAALVVYLYGTLALVREALVEAPLRSISQQLATQAKAWVYYMQLALGLQPQSVEHQFFASNWSDPVAFLSVAMLASAIFLASLWLWQYHRRGLFYLGWAVFALLPTLVVPLNMLVNERRLYLSLFAVMALMLCLPLRRSWKGCIYLVLACPLALMAVERNNVWQSEWALWQDAHAKAPLMARPHLRLGVLMREAGDMRGALRAYERALTLDRNSAPAHNNIGNVYRQLGQREKAGEAYARALQIWPNYVEALINLATLYSEMGQLQEADTLFMRALPLSQKRAEIYNNMGTNYLRMGDFNRAEKALRAALLLAGDAPRIYYNLGGALEGLGRFGEALEVYMLALAADSTYAPAHAKAGVLDEKRGQLERARRHYESFLRYWRGDDRASEDVRRRLDGLSVRHP